MGVRGVMTCCSVVLYMYIVSSGTDSDQWKWSDGSGLDYENWIPNAVNEIRIIYFTMGCILGLFSCTVLLFHENIKTFFISSQRSGETTLKAHGKENECVTFSDATGVWYEHKFCSSELPYICQMNVNPNGKKQKHKIS